MRFRAFAGAVVLALTFAGGASATFPGADGRVAFYAQVGCDRYSVEGDLCNAQSFSAFLTMAPGGGGTRALARCPGPGCVEAIGQRALWSPDGTLLAAEARAAEGATSSTPVMARATTSSVSCCRAAWRSTSPTG